MADVKTGSCGCGAVRFQTHAALRGVIYCHCIQCRKQSGHFFAATAVPADALKIDGEDELTWYGSSAEAVRGFCRVCGSALFWKSAGSDRISILAGAFDAPTGLHGERHIFVADKGEYYEIDDALPQHERW